MLRCVIAGQRVVFGGQTARPAICPKWPGIFRLDALLTARFWREHTCRTRPLLPPGVLPPR
jgi:hypothetical protein